MSSYYPPKKSAPENRTTEFDVLKASHKFLRREDGDDLKSWDAQLAKKYEDSLFKEFAVCDLKHYKSGNIALRWRTEDEVLSGTGEETCGNTRCAYHALHNRNEPTPSNSQDTRHKSPKSPKLTTLELPFSYVENGETQVQQVMVKVVLCERCVRKLTWKREKDKRERSETIGQASSLTSSAIAEGNPSIMPEKTDYKRKEELHEYIRNGRSSGNRNRSRSKSPRCHREP